MLRKGFTLLEVLVALAVITFALSAIIRVTGLNANNALYLENKTFANWVAVNIITETRLQAKVPSVKKGSVEMAKREWFWELKILDTMDSSLKRIEVAVKLNPDDERHLVNVIGFMPTNK
ncbi:type II secretion system minor pseudopilin GspI [Candidatus Albibeggiatoa sp. nov. NOAA]|uniref:type II secretion system minor pseudopilin GspI n=1 Tax=Candidatus Albibeggiatoa sp. nov. NOAA TaxID=3162724 RepID=UPI0033021185|nr:type II secretion system minor pseudopilin GspI [Thiotrichaceae bacterium]